MKIAESIIELSLFFSDQFLLAYDSSIQFFNNRFFYFGGKIMDLHKCNLEIFNSSFLSPNFSSLNESTLILCYFCNMISLNYSNVSGLNSYVYNPIHLLNSANISISYNRFSNSKGRKGGVIYSKNSDLYIKNNNFHNNYAEFGGNIYFQTDSYSKSKWVLYNNTFISSFAFYSGGSYYWMYSKPENELSNLFFYNSALTGNDFSSQPVFVLFHNSEDYMVLKNKFKPSQICNFSFQLKDFYNQTINYIEGENNAGILSFYGLPKSLNNSIGSYTIEGNTLVNFNKSFFNLSDIKVNIQTFCNFSIAFQINFIKPLEPNLFKYELPNIVSSQNVYSYVLDFQVLDCPVGYIYDHLTSSCNMCPLGKYSLNKNDKYCHDCIQNAECNKNGSFISLNIGYWRSHYYSTNVYECFNDFSCLGGDLCGLYYEGRLCDNCASNNIHQFYKAKNGKCQNCQDSQIAFISFSIVFLLVAIYTAYVIKMNIKEISNKSSEINTTSVFLKILADFLQINACFMNILGNLQKKLILDLMEYMPNIINIQGLIIPIDCVIFQMGAAEISVVYKRLLLISLVAVLSPFFFSFIWIIYSKIRYKTISYETSKKKVIVSLLIICYLYQPTAINIYFLYQDCFEIDGILYLKMDLKEICWEDNHLFFYQRIIFPFLCIWMFILPGILFVIMIKHMKRRRMSIVLMNKITYIGDVELKFFKEGYKESVFYWEFVHLLKKYLFIIFTVFLISDKLYWNALILNCISFFFLYLQILHQPYSLGILNQLSFVAHLIIYKTSIFIINIVFFVKNEEFQLLLIYACFALNLSFLVLWAFQLFSLKKDYLIKKLKNLSKTRRKAIKELTNSKTSANRSLLINNEKIKHIFFSKKNVFYS